MKCATLSGIAGLALLSALIFATSSAAAPKAKPQHEFKHIYEWTTVANNNDLMPDSGGGQGGHGGQGGGSGVHDVQGGQGGNGSDGGQGDHAGQSGNGGQAGQGPRTFNSYNQPSVNKHGLVVFRARSRGGSGQGQPTHGIYIRDMSVPGSRITRILDRSTTVPYPNNMATTFVETPSFPRIDMESATIATRGNHQPTWRYLIDGGETRGGTTGIYTNPFGGLVAGATKLGDIEDFYFYEVPGELLGTHFEVFPGSPSVTGGDTIVFKGNYTIEEQVDDAIVAVGKTGVYYRQLQKGPAGGNLPVVLVANNTDTLIPGTSTVFGSTSPPSAANGLVVFAGFDNEQAPTLGGLYLAPLQDQPPLTSIVEIGGQVPGESRGATFDGLGEGGAFDGRFIGFWGSWGSNTKQLRLYCATEGNKDRIAYCNRNLVCADTGDIMGDPNSICDGNGCYQVKEVPVNQGFFVHDTRTRRTWMVARTGQQFDEFLFWNYSGKTPCMGGGHSEEGAEDDGEPARWRSSAFMSVATRAGATFNVVFKARTGGLTQGVYTDAIDGIYQVDGPGQRLAITRVLDTTMNGRLVDPEAPVDSTITELGLEREGLRGQWLAINAKMGVEGGGEEDGMSGIYLTRLPLGR